MSWHAGSKRCPECGQKLGALAQKKRIVSLYRKGLSYREIAPLVGISFPHVGAVLRAAGVAPRGRKSR